MKIGGTEYPTIKDAAREFGVQPKTVQEWIAKGVVPKPPVMTHGIRDIQIFPEEYLEEARRALFEYRSRRHE